MGMERNSKRMGGVRMRPFLKYFLSTLTVVVLVALFGWVHEGTLWSAPAPVPMAGDIRQTSESTGIGSITGPNRDGGLVNVLTGTDMQLQQGGTLQAPTNENMWTVQPVDPTAGVFGSLNSGAIFAQDGGPDGGVFDPTFSIGYNIGQNSVNLEPKFTWAIEGRFAQAGNHIITESYFNYDPALEGGVGVSLRPIRIGVDRTNGSCTLEAAYTTGAQFAVESVPLDGGATTTVANIGDSVTTYTSIPPSAGYTLSGTTSINLESTNGGVQIQAQGAPGGQMNLLQSTGGQAILLATDAVQFADHGTNGYLALLPSGPSGGAASQFYTQPGGNKALEIGQPAGTRNTQDNSGLAVQVGYLRVTSVANVGALPTGYAPANGHSAYVKVVYNGRDIAFAASVAGEVICDVENSGAGAVLLGTPVATTPTGGAGLLTTVVTCSIVAGIVNVSATLPVAYSDGVDFTFYTTVLDN